MHLNFNDHLYLMIENVYENYPPKKDSRLDAEKKQEINSTAKNNEDERSVPAEGGFKSNSILDTIFVHPVEAAPEEPIYNNQNMETVSNNYLSVMPEDDKDSGIGFTLGRVFKVFNKFALLWGEAQLCLPYVCR